MKIIYYILPILLAASSIIYELGFAYSLSILYPNTYLHYSLTIGIFIFGLGVGTTLYNFLKTYVDKINMYIIVESILILSVPVFLYSLFNFETNNTTLFVLYFLILLVGTCSGVEIPLMTDLLGEKFTKILTLDYLGTLLGSLIFSLYFLPEFGIIITLLLTICINSITFLLFNKKSKIIGILFLSLITFLLFNNTFENMWINKWKTIIEEKNLCKERNCNVDIKNIQTTNYQTIVNADINYKNLINNEKDFNINCLYIDKEVQYCTNWENSYHTLLGVLPMELYKKTYNEKPKILILGGGDSLLYNKIIKYTNDIKVIDIDKYLTSTYFTDNKDVINTDAFNFLLNTKEKFDIIFWDLPMPTNKNLLSLYSNEMFKLIYHTLTDKGFFVHYVPIEDNKIFVPFASLIKNSGFNISYMYIGSHIKEDIELNKNTPFKYEEYFMISIKNNINLKNNIKDLEQFELKKINWKDTNFENLFNSIIFPNKNFILNY